MTAGHLRGLMIGMSRRPELDDTIEVRLHIPTDAVVVSLPDWRRMVVVGVYNNKIKARSLRSHGDFYVRLEDEGHTWRWPPYPMGEFS